MPIFRPITTSRVQCTQKQFKKRVFEKNNFEFLQLKYLILLLYTLYNLAVLIKYYNNEQIKNITMMSYKAVRETSGVAALYLQTVSATNMQSPTVL